MATLKEKTTKGLLWGGMNNAVQQLVGVIFGIILGRILFTEDYGMMAMISIFRSLQPRYKTVDSPLLLPILKPQRRLTTMLFSGLTSLWAFRFICCCFSVRLLLATIITTISSFLCVDMLF